MSDHTDASSVRDMLVVVMRQRRFIVVVYAAILAAAMAALFVITPRYRAAAKVLVTSNRAEVSTSADRPTQFSRSEQISREELASQVEILRSGELVEHVVDEMGLEPQPQTEPAPGTPAAVFGAPLALLRDAYHRFHGADTDPVGTPRDRLVEQLRKDLEVNGLANSNVIEVAMTERDPAFASDFVNRLTTAYLDWQASMQREAAAQDFFTEQSDLLRQKLNASETALRSLREQAGTQAGQQAELHDRLNEFSAELARSKIAHAGQAERVAFLEQVKASERHAGRVATPELLALEAQRAMLVGRYRPDSERVRAVDDQIKALQKAIAGYDTTTPHTGTAGGGDDGNGTDLVAARAALVALVAREKALASAQDEYRRQTELQESQSFDLARLERQAKLDEEEYLSYVRTAEQARLSNAIEQSKMLRLSVVERARAPLTPASPHKGRVIGFALLGGAVASLGLAFVRDQASATVKTVKDVRRDAAVDVLIALPERRSV